MRPIAPAAATQQLEQSYDIGQNLTSALAIGGAAIVCTVALLVFYFWRFISAGRGGEAGSANFNEGEGHGCYSEGIPSIDIDNVLPALSPKRAAEAWKRNRGEEEGAATSTECCAVCLAELFDEGDEEKQLLRLLPQCGHCFHSHCLDAWLQSRMHCPICRRSALPPPPPQAEAEHEAEPESEERK